MILLAVALIVILRIGLLALGSSHQLPVGPACNGLIAYESGGQIFEVDPDGSHRRDLTVGGTINTAPSFSPDGTRIAYWHKATAGSPTGLWVMNSDGSDQNDITGSQDFSSLENIKAARSPDSLHLAFAVGDYYSSTQLWVVGVDGSGLHIVGGGSLSRSDPGWSPDGKLIAFRGHTTGVEPYDYPPDQAIGVYVIAPDGTGQREVSRSAGAGGAPTDTNSGGPPVDTAPSWSPHGRSLVYTTGVIGHHTMD